MSSVEVISVELHGPHATLPQWTDALSKHVGQVPPAFRDREVLRCMQTTGADFNGRIELGRLGDFLLAKVGTTPNRFSRSLRIETASSPDPLLLCIEVSGSHRVEHYGRTCMMRPGDWCIADMRHRLDHWALGPRNEYLVLALERPSDPALTDLIDQGVGRRLDGKWGISRVIHATVTEAFKQLNRLGPSTGRSLQRAVSGMAWDALREQRAAPAEVAYHDLQSARMKAYIESHLADPELCVDAIAHACEMSLRSVHRAFETDPSGSVSKYIWTRRLSQCAAALRDPTQAQRSISDICFAWGFNSTSHFSRVFKDQYGVPPLSYRLAA
jgi:AraC-like DNA-binding protein